MADVIVTTLRLMGQRTYVSGMQQAASATHALDRRSQNLNTTGRYVHNTLTGVEGAINTLTSASLQLGAGLAVLGGYAVKTGVEFNAGMERATVGMTTLLGSGKEARRMVEDVTAFAVKTPLFGIEEMMQAAQQLIGVGFESKNVLPTLQTFSDTLSALGRKPEDLLRMRYAFTQMMSKGKISAEELRNQLGEIFPAQRILAREMGITTQKLQKQMKGAGVESGRGIRLLLRGMAEEYGGATDKMLDTFTGQAKQLQEGTRVMLGNMTFQFTNWLSRDMLPELNRFVSAMANTWDPERKMNLRQRLNRTKQLVRIILGPLADEIARKIERARIGDKLVRGLEAAIPRVMETMGRMSGQAALAFIRGWWDAGPYGKIFAAVVILSRLGAFSTAGGKAADMLIGGFQKKWAGTKTQTKFREISTATGRVMGRALAAGVVIGFALSAGYIAERIRDELEPVGDSISGWIDEKLGLGGRLKDLKDLANKLGPGGGIPGGRQHGGMQQRTQFTVVGEAGPEIVKLPAGARVYPSTSVPPQLQQRDVRGGSRQIVVPVSINGREIARAVANDTAYDMARR